MSSVDKKEVATSVVKSAFAAIPYAGQILNEIFFDYRGRIKQERLNKFTKLLSDYFSNNSDIELEKMKNEDFSDLLEAVLRKVVFTKSEEKLIRFRDILTNSIKSEPQQLENSEIYLDLVSSVSEVEIEILLNHRVFDKTYELKRENLHNLQGDLEKFKELQKKELKIYQDGYANNYDKSGILLNQKNTEINKLKFEIDSLDKFRQHSFYRLNEDRFLYYKQKLQSLGLLIDRGIGGFGVRSFDRMSITEFGKDFLSFILAK